MAAALALPTIPMLRPIFPGSSAKKCNIDTIISGKVALAPRNGKAKPSASFFCCSKPVSMAALSSKSQFNATPAPNQFSLRDTGFLSSQLAATAAALLNKDYINHPRTVLPPRHRLLSAFVARAADQIPGIPYIFLYQTMKEKKPRWWWRTLACIPYLMPLHVMSIYAEGAHQFLPFLSNFLMLTDPVFGNQLPGWCMIVYCLSVYYLIVRRKTWPHFFRFHVILAMLLDNTVQIIGIVARWMPYWSKLDAPFWTVVACGFLFVMSRCIRDALLGRYPDIPFFSEAAHMHAYLP